MLRAEKEKRLQRTEGGDSGQGQGTVKAASAPSRTSVVEFQHCSDESAAAAEATALRILAEAKIGKDVRFKSVSLANCFRAAACDDVQAIMTLPDGAQAHARM